MNRRAVLGLVATAGGVLGGCGQPTVTERPTGEIDVEFRTEATRSYLIRFRLRDANGDVADEFESEFPPDQPGAPSFFGAGLVDGPYTVTVETDADSTSFEWSITDCPRLDVEVTLLADGRLDVERICAGP